MAALGIHHAVDDGQDEGGCFSCSCLRTGQQIIPLKNHGYCFFLYGGGGAEAHRVKALQQTRVERKVVKSHYNLIFSPQGTEKRREQTASFYFSEIQQANAGIKF